MLTVQVVTAVPTFVLVPACVMYSLKVRSGNFHSILPAGLLLVDLQGLLGASAWPVAGLLAVVAFRGVSEPRSKEKQDGQTVSSDKTHTVFLVLLLASPFYLSWPLLCSWSLWLGTLLMCFTNVVVSLMCAYVTSDSTRWEFDAGDAGEINWTQYEPQQNKDLEDAWKNEAWKNDGRHFHHFFESNRFEYRVDVKKDQMEQRNVQTGKVRKVRRLLVKHAVNNLDASTAGCAFTFMLAGVWCLFHVLWTGWFYVPLEQDTSQLCLIATAIKHSTDTSVGHILHLDGLGYDFALFLALLLHRHRLIRRGEWSDGDDLNSDLSSLPERSFSLLPNVQFWDVTILRSVKQTLAVEIQKSRALSKAKAALTYVWVASFALVLTAGSMALACLFGDIPTGFDSEEGTIQWMTSSSSSNNSFVPVMILMVVLFSIIGLLSWTVVCDVSDLGTDKDTEQSPKTTAADSSDRYIPILCCQLVALPLVGALYFERTGQSASQISQSVTESSAVPTSIVALGFGVFVLIIADRAVYMLESRTCKLVMLWCSLITFCGYWIYDDSKSDTLSDSSWSPIHVLLTLVCSAYFYESAIQLEIKLKRTHGRRFTQYTKVPGDTQTWVHWFRWPIRKTPFLMELVYLVRKSFCTH